MGVLFQNDFDRNAMDQLAHRPYAMPTTPWLMTQAWHHVLFLHWPVDDRMLRELLPDGLELDVYEGQACVAITPFYMVPGSRPAELRGRYRGVGPPGLGNEHDRIARGRRPTPALTERLP